MRHCLSVIYIVFCLLLFTGITRAYAHPMGNFSINQYSAIHAEIKNCTIEYVVDFAEIPAVQELNAIAKVSGGNRKGTTAGDAAYLLKLSFEIGSNLQLTANGIKVTLECRPISVLQVPGAGGLPTVRALFEFTGKYQPDASGKVALQYKDGNYNTRTGWKEIIADAAAGSTIVSSDVPVTDITHKLTQYPSDPTIAPLLQLDANLVVKSGAGSAAPPPVVPLIPRVPGSSATRSPRDAFTDTISRADMNWRVMAFSLLIAFVFGALHGLSPGHGKAMVGAYLIGSRGTAKHAVALGIIVTITHTLGVFIVGAALLGAAKWFVPEKIYPVLTGLSGLTIALLGAFLFNKRWKQLKEGSEEVEFEGDGKQIPLSTFNANLAGSAPAEPESEPISFKSLVALGITGGALPCPSALIVLLSAFALHRTALGLTLVCAFSLGLAVVLTAIGLIVVKVRGFAERAQVKDAHRSLLNKLPVAGAAFVTVVGIILFAQSLFGRGY